MTGLKELANYYNKISCYSPINRWRNLSLHRPQPITESEAVRMYMNNLRPDMAVYLQGVRPITFEELASKATEKKNIYFLSHIARRSKFVDKVTSKEG